MWQITAIFSTICYTIIPGIMVMTGDKPTWKWRPWPNLIRIIFFIDYFFSVWSRIIWKINIVQTWVKIVKEKNKDAWCEKSHRKALEYWKCTLSFLACNSCRVVPPAVMDVWDHSCHPTPFQEEMIHVPAYTSWEMAPTSAIYVWKKGWDQLNTCQHCFARQCEPILNRSFSYKAGSKRTCCSVFPFHFMCVFPRLWVRLIYTHSAGNCFIFIYFFRWSATLTL